MSDEISYEDRTAIGLILRDMSEMMWINALDEINRRVGKIDTEVDRHELRAEILSTLRNHTLTEQSIWNHNVYNRNLAKYAVDYIEAAQALQNLSIATNSSGLTKSALKDKIQEQYGLLATRIDNFRSSGKFLESNRSLNDLHEKLEDVLAFLDNPDIDLSKKVLYFDTQVAAIKSNLKSDLNLDMIADLETYLSGTKNDDATLSSTAKNLISHCGENVHTTRRDRKLSGFSTNRLNPTLFLTPLGLLKAPKKKDESSKKKEEVPLKEKKAINKEERAKKIRTAGIVIALAGGTIGTFTPIPLLINSINSEIDGTHLYGDEENDRMAVEADIAENNETINIINETYGKMGDVTLSGDLDEAFAQIDEGYESVKYVQSALETGNLNVDSQIELCDNMVMVIDNLFLKAASNGWLIANPTTTINSKCMDNVEENDEKGTLEFNIEYYDNGFLQDGDELKTAHIHFTPKGYFKELNGIRMACNSYMEELQSQEYSDDDLLALYTELQDISDEYIVYTNVSPNFGMFIGTSLYEEVVNNNFYAIGEKSDDFVAGLETNMREVVEERNKQAQEQIQEEIQNDDTEPEASTLDDDESR